MFDPDEMPRWVQALVQSEGVSANVVAGVNDDDCAVLEQRGGFVVITTDFINAWPIADQLKISTSKNLGALIVKNNVSDLLGTGAEPKGMLLGITLEREASKDEYREIVLGAYEEAKKYNLPIVGGDSKLGPSRALYGVAIGAVEGADALFLKNHAQEGDDIWVSGAIGSCAAATVLLHDKGGSASLRGWAAKAILDPDLPYKKSRKLSGERIANGGTDISDGLSADINDICEASRVGARLVPACIPVEESVEIVAKIYDIPAWTFSFALGGDMQFIVTANPAYSEKMKSLGLTRIGDIVAGSGVKLECADKSDRPMQILGHRDATNLTFYDEAWKNIDDVLRVWGKANV